MRDLSLRDRHVGPFPPVLGLGVVVLLAAAIRVWLATESLWLDELHTAWVAIGPFGDVVTRAAAGNQPPLFFWMEWVTIRVVGANEIGVRLLSIIAGSLLPAAVYVLASRWTRSPWIALLVALLVALEPQSISFGSEARPYALIELLAVVHIGVVDALARRASLPLRLAFVAGAALLFHLHYLTALLIATEIGWLAVSMLWRRPEPHAGRYRPAAFAIDVGVVAAVCALALPYLRAIFARRDNWHLVIKLAPASEIVSALPWEAAALVMLIGALAARRWLRAPAPPHPAAATIGLTVAWLVGPATLAWIASAADVVRIFFPRYLRPSAPAAFILVAIALSLVPHRRVRIGIATVIAVLAVYHSHLLSSNPRERLGRKDDWRGAIAYLNEQYRSRPYPIVFWSGLVECTKVQESRDPGLLAYCLYPLTSLYPLKIDRRDLVPYGNEPPNLERAVRLRGGVWMVERWKKLSIQLFTPPDSTKPAPTGR